MEKFEKFDGIVERKYDKKEQKEMKRMNHIFVEAYTREEAMSQYILPNISQMNTNFVITDRDGYIYGQTKGFLKNMDMVFRCLT